MLNASIFSDSSFFKIVSLATFLSIDLPVLSKVICLIRNSLRQPQKIVNQE